MYKSMKRFMHSCWLHKLEHFSTKRVELRVV